MRRQLRFLILPLFALSTVGCASLGDRVGLAGGGAGRPSAAEVLGDLAENDARIETFRAAGTFTLESPEFDAVKKFRGGRIMFQRPADLFVQGNHRITNITLFKLRSAGDEFLMEFPTDKKQSFYQLEGEQFEDVPFTVSPADIALEMFLPEPWAELGRFKARLTDYDPASARATLAIGPRRAPHRRVIVARSAGENPRWVMVQNERLNEEGDVLAVTLQNDYHELDGALFPAVVDAWFPTEATRMRFEMRNIRLNVELPEGQFDVRARAEELRLWERTSERQP